MSCKKQGSAFNSIGRLKKAILPILAIVVLLLLIFAPTKAQIKQRDTMPIVPTVATADRHQGNRIFLERASSLIARPQFEYQILTGDVMFRKGDMLMYCDSAHLYEETNSIEAFGNVRMEQGDTLFVYADELVYTDSTELAVLYGNNGRLVKLINRDVELQTNPFYYDLGIDLGYYDNYGTLTDAKNKLYSRYGEYAPGTSEALFRENVSLQSRNEGDTLTILTEELYYNTKTHMAEMDMPSIIINRDGKIFTDSATYNTETSFAELYKRSVVVSSQNTTLTGDSLKYDKNAGFGEAFGNVIMTDSAHSMILCGDYGFYNELTDSAFVTGRALAKEYSQGDTLYLHSDTIRTFAIIIPEYERDSILIPADTTHLVVAAHMARFYRSDMQGLCDSMTFVQTDSMLYLDIHPVVWSDNRQIFGTEIEVHLNDSTIDYAKLPDFGFMAEEIEEGFYQQLTGSEMTAYFEDGHLVRLEVSGNVEALSLPQEADSTYNKFATLESSFLTAWFKGNMLERMKAWPATTSVITPLYLAKRSQLYLPQFKWYTDMRPTSPEDVFNIPESMVALMAEPVESKKRNLHEMLSTSRREAAAQAQAPQPSNEAPIDAPNEAPVEDVKDLKDSKALKDLNEKPQEDPKDLKDFKKEDSKEKEEKLTKLTQ
ncbi:MAG: hypothetical protein K2K27_06160 [Muribaculaceae bacterium]|nr:hypothetical protein [Muribaculaceae bacterium]